MEITPYPCADLEPCQTQHSLSEEGVTCLAKRVLGGSDFESPKHFLEQNICCLLLDEISKGFEQARQSLVGLGAAIMTSLRSLW